MIPGFRAIPPSPAQLAADANAPHILFLAGDRDELALVTSAVGLGIDLSEPIARVVASRADLERLSDALSEGGHPLARPLGHYLHPVTAWKLRSKSLPLDVPVVMGILNLTSDSFSGDGVGTGVAGALQRAEELRRAGATIVDAGAESARADRPVMDEEQEASLVAEVVKALVSEGHIVSSDTYKPLVARAALESGAEIVNDISGLTQGNGAALEAAQGGAGYVLNYSYSVPKQRPESPPRYQDVVMETIGWMEAHVAKLIALGLTPAQVAIDPGIAFGKSHDEDIQVLRRLGEFRSLGLPLLLAHSRKNFIGSITGRSPAERDLETHVVTALACEQGVRVFRVHDVAGTRRALAMAAALASAAKGHFAPDDSSWPWRAGADATHMTQSEPDKAAPEGQRW